MKIPTPRTDGAEFDALENHPHDGWKKTVQRIADVSRQLEVECEELRQQLGDSVKSVLEIRDELDPGGVLSIKGAMISLNEYIEIGKRWRKNSSLEEWFPFSAQKLKALEAECGSAAAIIVRQNQEIEQLRAQIEQSNAETMHNTKHDAEPSSRSGLAHTHGQVA